MKHHKIVMHIFRAKKDNGLNSKIKLNSKAKSAIFKEYFGFSPKMRIFLKNLASLVFDP